MGQEVKNPLRAQSKYGLMGSSAKRGKKNFRGSPDDFLHKNAILDRTSPHLHIKCSLHVCGRVQGSQIFKQNSIISFCSKVMALLVISLSPWSPRCPRHPRIIPIVPTSCPHHPCHPHIVPIAPRRSPCGLHGCGLSGLHPMFIPMVPMLSLSSPRHPCCPHIIPTSSRMAPHHPQSPRYPLHPPSPPWGSGGPWFTKNAIRFELIEIF